LVVKTLPKSRLYKNNFNSISNFGCERNFNKIFWQIRAYGIILFTLLKTFCKYMHSFGKNLPNKYKLIKYIYVPTETVKLCHTPSLQYTQIRRVYDYLIPLYIAWNLTNCIKIKLPI